LVVRVKSTAKGAIDMGLEPPIPMLHPEDLSPTDEALLDLLANGRVTAPYAAEATEYNLQHIRDRLSRLVEHKHVEKVHEGLYELESDPRA
jgi:hypothetical protein